MLDEYSKGRSRDRSLTSNRGQEYERSKSRTGVTTLEVSDFTKTNLNEKLMWVISLSNTILSRFYPVLEGWPALISIVASLILIPGMFISQIVILKNKDYKIALANGSTSSEAKTKSIVNFPLRAIKTFIKFIIVKSALLIIISIISSFI